MRIGYARVSTHEQNLDIQEDALKAAGCEKIYTDKTGGTKAERTGLERALADLRAGDRLVVWKLDRLGRSLRHLIETVTNLRDRGVGFQSLQEAIDTKTSGGKLIFHVFGALAEFDRDLIRERTLAGLATARTRGRKGGRPRDLDDKKKRHASLLHSDPTNSGKHRLRPGMLARHVPRLQAVLARQIATFSPDGRRIVTASDGNTARVWDAETGKPLIILQGTPGASHPPPSAPMVGGSSSPHRTTRR
jgi:DNA invertase Pin-like site-specific DNA recombinase